MEKKESTYELQLCAVGDMLAAKTYRYSLLRYADENQYCISISEWQQDKQKAEYYKKFAADSAEANNVVQCLYQNAVAPVHLHDVLHDLMLQGYIAMQE